MQFRHLVKRLNWVIGFAIQIHSVGNSLLSKTQKEMFSLPLALSFTRIMIIMCGSGSETKTRNQNDASCHQNSECVCMNPLARFPNCQAICGTWRAISFLLKSQRCFIKSTLEPQSQNESSSFLIRSWIVEKENSWLPNLRMFGNIEHLAPKDILIYIMDTESRS